MQSLKTQIATIIPRIKPQIPPAVEDAVILEIASAEMKNVPTENNPVTARIKVPVIKTTIVYKILENVFCM